MTILRLPDAVVCLILEATICNGNLMACTQAFKTPQRPSELQGTRIMRHPNSSRRARSKHKTCSLCGRGTCIRSWSGNLTCFSSQHCLAKSMLRAPDSMTMVASAATLGSSTFQIMSQWLYQAVGLKLEMIHLYIIRWWFPSNTSVVFKSMLTWRLGCGTEQSVPQKLGNVWKLTMWNSWDICNSNKEPIGPELCRGPNILEPSAVVAAALMWISRGAAWSSVVSATYSDPFRPEMELPQTNQAWSKLMDATADLLRVITNTTPSLTFTDTLSGILPDKHTFHYFIIYSDIQLGIRLDILPDIQNCTLFAWHTFWHWI